MQAEEEHIDEGAVRLKVRLRQVMMTTVCGQGDDMIGEPRKRPSSAVAKV
jgi:uncharacterized protein (UPF0210 family)